MVVTTCYRYGMTTNPPIVSLPDSAHAQALREALQEPDDGLPLDQAAVVATDGETYHTRRRGLRQVIRRALAELSRPEYRNTKPLKKPGRDVGWE